MSKRYERVDNQTEEAKQRAYKAALQRLDPADRRQIEQALAAHPEAKPSNHLELDEGRIADIPQPQREETLSIEQAEWIASDPLAMSIILLKRASPHDTIRQIAAKAKTSKSRVDRYLDKITAALPQSKRLLGRLGPRALSQQSRRAAERAKGQAL